MYNTTVPQVSAAAYKSMTAHGKQMVKRLEKNLKKAAALKKAHPTLVHAGVGPNEAQALGKVCLRRM